jgi:hypothetical protein
MLPQILLVIKGRRIRWVGNVACMGEMRNMYILIGTPEGKRPLEDLVERIILEWFLRK